MPTCADVMTRNPVTVVEGASATQVAQLMKTNDVGSIPVVDREECLIGIITDRDLVLHVVANGSDCGKTTVGGIMTANPGTCGPSDDIERAIEVMEGRQVRRVPVVEDGNRLVGMITQADIANRVGSSKRTAEVVEEISRPTE